MEVLKLILFLRDEDRRKKHRVRAGDIYKSVAEVLGQAGFITKSRIDREVAKIHKEYKMLLQNNSKLCQGQSNVPDV